LSAANGDQRRCDNRQRNCNGTSIPQTAHEPSASDSKDNGTSVVANLNAAQLLQSGAKNPPEDWEGDWKEIHDRGANEI
jgi:hypothetical protein